MDADQLRAQAARCFRAALTCPDPTLATELIEIGWAFREEAERLERQAFPVASSEIRIAPF